MAVRTEAFGKMKDGREITRFLSAMERAWRQVSLIMVRFS